MKFIAEESYWNLFPNSKLGIVLIEDMNNGGESSKEIKEALMASNEEAKKYFIKDNFSENPVISVWREAYQKFKTKKGVRSSIEALLKRVEKGNEVSSINPLVDIYNTISLKYGMPCGAEDSDTFKGILRLGITEGNDEFYLIGEDKNSPTLQGELCYRDDEGAVCRCFNWRDGKRTMVTDKTKNAFLIIELIDNEREKELNDALNEIAENIEKYLMAKTKIVILSKDNREI
ncbi:B3/4 domain-containing protein [Streptobacillus moniliformis]|uniref:B3/4 domain protein n=1 Tax=Streptobacillus moniliformis (strain ATCC 14647 / DSM 12112 / NCTC 10651 / 9901) TaxID=519441 RepID=D1AWE8_STRM9|nr:B3/4 domain-containing protein [Streptobacillus moniliformis]ACZ00624.1 B3/4 domain protein [Streptobacillus moniliformis DSM 12112]QXW65391.1 B3/4 domain-containing protein [Streptobacillus moniliformis]SQA14250.1 phenylalanine--tRNA ligase, beta subunit [Streptobacillus moniliformis]